MEVNYMNLKMRGLMLLLIFTLLSGCSTKKLSNAEFTNVPPPTIKMNNYTYVMTEVTLSTNDVEEQIGKVTKINVVASYPPDKDPYKNPRRIYKVKDIKIEDAIAIEVNGKLYMAKIKK